MSNRKILHAAINEHFKIIFSEENSEPKNSCVHKNVIKRVEQRKNSFTCQYLKNVWRKLTDNVLHTKNEYLSRQHFQASSFPEVEKILQNNNYSNMHRQYLPWSFIFPVQTGWCSHKHIFQRKFNFGKRHQTRSSALS